jgi:flagellar hook-length control protein FliK
MNSTPAALAALVAPSFGAGAGPGACTGAPLPIEAGADEPGVGFAGLLGPDVEATSPAVVDGAAATDIVGIAPPAPTPTPLPAPACATPPPMSDPATTAVLNALALRVATESNAATPALGVGACTPAATVASQPAIAGLGLALQALGSAIAQVTGQPAAGRAPANTVATAAIAATVAASGTVRLPLPASTGDAVATERALDTLMADLAPTKAGGNPGTALGVAAAPADLPGPTGTAQAALAPLAMPLAAVANIVAALSPPSSTAAETDLSMLAGVQAGASADTGALAAATSSASAPAQASATGPLQPAAFQAFLRADGSLPQIAVPMDSPQWGNELSTRVVALAREQFTEAQIRITPDELGPIEVKLRFEGDRVHAQFGAISPEAREALSANLHRLREMLAGEGLNLGQAFVGHHGADRQPGQPGAPGRSSSGGDASGDELGISSAAPRHAATRVGLLDEFA